MLLCIKLPLAGRRVHAPPAAACKRVACLAAAAAGRALRARAGWVGQADGAALGVACQQLGHAAAGGVACWRQQAVDGVDVFGQLY